MNDEQQKHAEERQLRLYERMNQKLKNKIGELQLDFFAVSSELEITKDEKMILAKHIQEQEEEIEQLKGMLNIQDGAEEPDGAAPEVQEIKPNREARRAEEKAAKKRA